MLSRLDLRGTPGDLRRVLEAPRPGSDEVRAAVSEIVAAVRAEGDAALQRYTERFDGCRIDSFELDPGEIASAPDRVDPALVAALEFARDQILAWHEAQREREAKHERSGIHVHELILPVERAGCYVPGGRAAYPSSVLMTAIPARVAGVPEISLCVPPGADGLVADVTLAAAAIAGVDSVYRVGGAQAIAAMAYGTETVPRVDVVVGPGNAYIAEAKRQVIGDVGIDAIAGPSELVVIADRTADPELVAADLLAQAEHGPGGAAIVVTWHDDVADAVEAALARQLAATARREDAASTLATGGRIVLVEDAERALDAANAIAPEHLELQCADAALLVPLVRNAGAVFVGADAPAVIGDYVAGVNHVLPTGATARFASALRVANFQKRVHVVSVDPDALTRVAPFITVIADAEGLTAHADSVRLRGGNR